jgi:DNA uptake protein ComE-like DNA-binding protein
MMKRLVVFVGAMLLATPAFAQEEKAGAAPAAPAPAPGGAARAKAAAPAPAPAPGPAPGAAAATSAAEPKKREAKAPLMDLNSASADELKTLPGVDDALAQKIIAGRPYKGKDELWKRKLMDKDAYAKVRPLVIAKQPKAEPAKK